MDRRAHLLSTNLLLLLAVCVPLPAASQELPETRLPAQNEPAQIESEREQAERITDRPTVDSQQRQELQREQSPRAAMGADEERERAADQERPVAPGESAARQGGRDVVYQKQVRLSGGELSTIVKRSTQTVQRMLHGQESQIPPDLVSRAQCVAVFPSVTKAALLIGGEHGTGVATCRGPAGQWSQLGFVDLTGAGLGAQLGAKTSDMMFFFLSDKARDRLREGKLSFGAELSATMGDAKSAKEMRVKFPSEDVVGFAESEGAFLGASLDGVQISADEEKLKEFYDENARFERVIATYDIPGEPLLIRDFIQLLPSRERSS